MLARGANHFILTLLCKKHLPCYRIKNRKPLKLVYKRELTDGGVHYLLSKKLYTGAVGFSRKLQRNVLCLVEL